MNGWLELLEGTPIGVFFIVTIGLAEYLRIYFTTNIDLLFMSKKEEQKRFLARFIVVCCLLLAINFIISIAEAFVVAVGIILLIVCICSPVVFGLCKMAEWSLRKIQNKFKTTCNLYVIFQKYEISTRIKKYAWLMILVMCGPISSYFMGKIKNYDLNLIVVIVSVVQTIIIFIHERGFISEESKITINERKSKRTLYVYKKVNDKYLLCGDNSKMKNAKEISMIKIEALYLEEFYLGIEN